MARYTESVCKLCRREGEKLFLKGERCFTPKCAFERRAYAPGQHGAFFAITEEEENQITAASCGQSRKQDGFMAFWKNNSAAISHWQ